MHREGPESVNILQIDPEQYRNNPPAFRRRPPRILTFAFMTRDQMIEHLRVMHDLDNKDGWMNQLSDDWLIRIHSFDHGGYPDKLVPHSHNYMGRSISKLMRELKK